MSTSPPPSTPDESPLEVPRAASVPGKYVVLAMLGFGICATGFMWIYTYLSNRPFIPLRHALVQKFKRESSPRVEGGKERGRGPAKLRVVLAVRFDPTADTPEAKTQRETMERETITLAKQHLDISQYQAWEFILIRYSPEGLPKRWTSQRDIADIQAGRY